MDAAVVPVPANGVGGAMTVWRLKLLGGFALSRDGAPEAGTLGRRDRALLAYLALFPNRRQPRERIATLLWAHRGGEQARHSLAESLRVLRKALDDEDKAVIVSEGDALLLNLERVEVDAHLFERLAVGGSQDALEQARALYAGELLDGLELGTEDTAGFDDWLRVERGRLRELAIAALVKLASLHLAAGHAEQAIAAAQSALRLDPLREEAHRALMRGYAQGGRRAAALQQFRALGDRLREELQVEPEAETVRLHQEIRTAAGEPAELALSPTARPSPPGPAASAPTTQPQRYRVGARRLARGRRALKWAAVGAATALLAAATTVGATFWRIPELAPAPLGVYIGAIKGAINEVVPGGERPSIAVLPFRSQGDEDAAQYADAIGEGITAALSMASDMRVVARASVLVYEGRPAKIQQIAADLGVRYVLEGGVQKWGNRVRVQIGLIDTRAGEHRLWTQTMEREAADVFALQKDVTLEVVTSLEVSLTAGEQERIDRAHGAINFDAWLEASQGEMLLRRLTPEDNAKARLHYEKARGLDPNYPGASDGLAWTYFLDARFGWSGSPAQSIARAAELAQASLALDPERPRTYSLLGAISLLAGDHDQAVGLGEKAVELGANDADAAALLAYTLTYSGEPYRATALAQRAIRLRPYPPDWYGWLLGRAHRLTGRYEEAVGLLEKASAAMPTSYTPLLELAAAYSEMGAKAKAKAAADAVKSIYPGFSVGAWAQAPSYKDPAMTEREAALLIRMGLPD